MLLPKTITRTNARGCRCASSYDAIPKVPSLGGFMLFAPRHPEKGLLVGMRPAVHLFWPQAYARYGPVTRMCFPGGAFLRLCRPEDMLPVLQHEGKYPFGGVQMHWPTRKWARQRGHASLSALFGEGEEWKAHRAVLQKHILPPAAAQSYLPGVAAAAALASRGMAHYETDMKEFAMRAAWDMVATVLLGRFPNTTDPATDCDPLDESFMRNSVEALDDLVPLLSSAWQNVAHRAGYDTAWYKKYAALFDAMHDRAYAILNDLHGRAAAGQISAVEAECYAVKTFRQAETAGMSLGDVNGLIMMLLIAAVDTTSGVINWCLVHLAHNPDKQAILRREVMEVLQGGPLTTELLPRLPYLRACIRESHRLTPALPFPTMKRISQDLEVAGHRVPAGTMIGFDLMSIQNDPEVVGSDAAEFRPERWLPEAVAARKGTPAEVLDHRLLAAPFSAGARMCPGSRVANQEVLALIAQVLQDWELELTSPYEDVVGLQGLVVQPSPMPSFKLTPVASSQNLKSR